MLIDFERGSQHVRQVYFSGRYRHWQGMLFRHNPLAIGAISQDIHGLFSARAGHPTAPVITWKWVVGANWPQPFADIYAAMNPAGLTTPSAVNQAYANAALFLGLIFMDVAIQQREWWGSHHCELNGVPITARTYYLLTAPPAWALAGRDRP